MQLFSRKELEDTVAVDDSELPELRIQYHPDLKEVYAEAVSGLRKKGQLHLPEP